MPRLLLVLPSPTRRHLYRIKLAKTVFPPLGLLTVAAHTPPDFDIRLVDESVHRLDYALPVDLVAISANTASAPRAYEVASEFRRRGAQVVIGGIHATALPEEALQYADTVGVGEAEGYWAKLCRDFCDGKLQPIYRNEELPSLDHLPLPRRDLINPKDYHLPRTIQTSRGCPFRCTFCSVHKFFGGRYRLRPVGQVIEEVKLTPGKSPLIFVDDNIFADRERSLELFAALEPLQESWFGQVSMVNLQDEDFLHRAGQSGCRMVFVGLETLSADNLKDINKQFNKPDQVKETIARCHRHGIGVIGAFIVGLDHDDISVFEHIVDFAMDAQLDLVQIAIRIPIPGTDDSAALAPRIFDPHYERRDGTRAVFFHEHIHPPILLEEKLQWAYQQIYCKQGIRRRLSGHDGPYMKVSRIVNKGFALRASRWLRRLSLGFS